MVDLFIHYKWRGKLGQLLFEIKLSWAHFLQGFIQLLNGTLSKKIIIRVRITLIKIFIINLIKISLTFFILVLTIFLLFTHC